MRAVGLVARLRYREWEVSAHYWLSVVGVDFTHPDVFTRLYLVYILMLGGLWVVVSAAGAAALVHSLGSAVPPAHLAVGLPDALGLGLVAWLAASLAHPPLRLRHGDLEWLAPSPISRRVLALADMIPRAVRVGVVLGFGGILLASALHVGPTLPWGALVGGAAATAAAWGFVLSLWRATRPGPPVRWLWPLPLAVLPLLGSAWTLIPAFQSVRRA